jgi:hypothetical protein
MNEILFHSSWWLLACVAAGGIALFVVGNRRLDKNIQRIALAVIAVTFLLGCLRFFFPTARERMENRSRAIVRAFDGKHWDTLKSLMDPDTVVSNRSRVILGGRDSIMARAEEVSDEIKLVKVIGLESEQTETLIRVSLELYSVQAPSADRPATSTWQMDYEQSGDTWVLQSINALRFGADGSMDYIPELR